MTTKTKTKKPVEWWFVYRGTNKTQKEVYHGISKEIVDRITKSHCVGGTKALSHWDCSNDNIEWEQLSKHKTQTKASEISHKHEHKFTKRGYNIIITAGK